VEPFPGPGDPDILKVFVCGSMYFLRLIVIARGFVQYSLSVISELDVHLTVFFTFLRTALLPSRTIC